MSSAVSSLPGRAARWLETWPPLRGLDRIARAPARRQRTGNGTVRRLGP